MVLTTVQPERHVIWHPRQENTFVVGGGSQITLYEWSTEPSEIRQITSRHDLQLMKCFAWSPDPLFNDLVAVGTSTGRVDLMRLGATRSTRNGILSSGHVSHLPTRSSRPCNALAFSNVDPNYLAVGLDKARGESSLVVWDIQSTSMSLALPSDDFNQTMADRIERPQPTIAKADVTPRADPRVLQQHAPTEAITALSFLPKSTSVLMAGISHRWLRLLDLRASSPAVTSAVFNKVQAIVTDPFDEHRFACVGDGLVSVWDARRLPRPLLMFSEKDALADGSKLRANSVYSTVEFSSIRRGVLATLEKDGSFVRFWDTIQTHSQAKTLDGDSRESSQSGRAHRKSWANLPWSGSLQQSNTVFDSPLSSFQLSLSNTRKTRVFDRPLSSFALVPNSRTHPLTSEIMLVNKDGDLELYSLHDTPKPTLWSAQGDLAIGAGVSYRMFHGFTENGHSQNSDGNPLSTVHSTSQLDKAPSPGESAPVRFRHEDRPESSGRGIVSPRLRSLAIDRSLSPAPFHDRQSSENRPHRDHSRSNAGRAAQGVTNDKSYSKSHKKTKHNVQSLVQDDISMVMRKRVVNGYGLSSPERNREILKAERSSSSLIEVWSWLNSSLDPSLPQRYNDSFDFAYRGLLGVWTDFDPRIASLPDSVAPTPKNAHLDLPGESLLMERTHSGSSRKQRRLRRKSRSPNDGTPVEFREAVKAAHGSGDFSVAWRLGTPGTRSAQRKAALELCGWSMREEDLNESIRAWEKEQLFSKAACWLVFTKQYGKASDLLMRSNDESHRMMSGMLTALIHNSRNSELRDHCARLLVRLQDPYSRAMLTQLNSGDWTEVLEEEALPLRERLAIAIQFLDDHALTSFFRSTVKRSCDEGDIEGLIVTGLTTLGLSVLQSYVDRTGDVQTASMLASYVCPAKFDDKRVHRWLDSYRDLLDGFKLFHHRVSFDVERGQILKNAVQRGDIPSADWAPPQISIRCNYCNKAMNAPRSTPPQSHRSSACPHCGRLFPRCSICLMSLDMLHDPALDTELDNGMTKGAMDDAVVICQTCRHGGHASHVLEWFMGVDGNSGHVECPVADCKCHCAEE